jgi:hypothetical protein
MVLEYCDRGCLQVGRCLTVHFLFLFNSGSVSGHVAHRNPKETQTRKRCCNICCMCVSEVARDEDVTAGQTWMVLEYCDRGCLQVKTSLLVL